MEKKETEKIFIEMIHKYEKVIYKVCSFYVTEDYPLADLYQETVANLWKGFPQFRNESAISTWIYRIALNTCISRIRKSAKDPQRVSIALSDDMRAEPLDIQEEIKEMHLLIRQLGTLERAIVLLWLEEKSYQEIADITGISTANVGTRLKRIKLKLKEMSKQ